MDREYVRVLCHFRTYQTERVEKDAQLMKVLSNTLGFPNTWFGFVIYVIPVLKAVIKNFGNNIREYKRKVSVRWFEACVSRLESNFQEWAASIVKTSLEHIPFILSVKREI